MEGREIFQKLVERKEGGGGILLKNCLAHGVQLYANSRLLPEFGEEEEEVIMRIWYLGMVAIFVNPENEVTIWDGFEIGLTLLEASLGRESRVDERVSGVEVVNQTRNTFSVKFTYLTQGYEFNIVTQETDDRYSPFILLSPQRESNKNC